MLASKKMRQAISPFPESIEYLSPGDWCKCVCPLRVAEFHEVTKQVKVLGEISGEGDATIQIHLSCSYQHFSLSDTGDQISSYSTPFVNDRETVKLEMVFLVLTATVVNGIHVVSGSPLYMAIPESTLPWQK